MFVRKSRTLSSMPVIEKSQSVYVKILMNYTLTYRNSTDCVQCMTFVEKEKKEPLKFGIGELRKLVQDCRFSGVKY